MFDNPRKRLELHGLPEERARALSTRTRGRRLVHWPDRGAESDLLRDRSSLVAQRLPIPLRNRLRPLLGFCHLKRSDQPFETHLQTAWISFGKQMRLTFASVEGGIRQTG